MIFYSMANIDISETIPYSMYVIHISDTPNFSVKMLNQHDALYLFILIHNKNLLIGYF